MSAMSCLRRTLGLLTLAATLAVCSCTTCCLSPGAHERKESSTARSGAGGSAARRPFDETADARNDIATALAMAKADGKNVLLDFGANWCSDCIALARIFDDKSVRPFLQANFHLVKINVGEKDKNLDLVKEYDDLIEKGIPAVVVLNSAGKVLTTTKGGELANAEHATKKEILAYLRQWAPAKS